MSSLSSRARDLQALADVLLAEVLAAAAGVDEDARQRHQAREALGPDRRLLLRRHARRWPRRASSARPRCASTAAASSGPSVWRSCSSSTRSATSSASACGASTRAFSRRPRTNEAIWRLIAYGVDEDDRAVVLVAHLAEAAEVALDLPGDALGHPHLGGVDRLAELPLGAAGVRARVEVGRALEVVLGLRRVRDLAAACATGGRRGSRRARASGRRGRTARPGRAGGTGRPCAPRPRRAPSCSSRT